MEMTHPGCVSLESVEEVFDFKSSSVHSVEVRNEPCCVSVRLRTLTVSTPFRSAGYVKTTFTNLSPVRSVVFETLSACISVSWKLQFIVTIIRLWRLVTTCQSKSHLRPNRMFYCFVYIRKNKNNRDLLFFFFFFFINGLLLGWL